MYRYHKMCTDKCVSARTNCTSVFVRENEGSAKMTGSKMAFTSRPCVPPRLRRRDRTTRGQGSPTGRGLGDVRDPESRSSSDRWCDGGAVSRHPQGHDRGTDAPSRLSVTHPQVVIRLETQTIVFLQMTLQVWSSLPSSVQMGAGRGSLAVSTHLGVIEPRRDLHNANRFFEME